MLRNLIRKFIELLDRIVPKNNSIAFSSYPDYSDNSYALFKYLMNKKVYEKIRISWLVDGDPKKFTAKILEKWGIELNVKRKLSFLGVLTYLKSQTVFMTHGIYGDIGSFNNKKRVNLWHGMPIKKVGLLDKNSKGDKVNSDSFVVTSPLYQPIFSELFGINKSKIQVLGQARNDLLFEQTDYYRKSTIDKKAFKKTVIWMPTYKRSIVGDVRTDGTFDDQKISILKLTDLNRLNKYLVKSNVLLLIKLHPMDYLNSVKIETFTNIRILNTGTLESLDVHLYPLLGSCDALLTDYSSVYIDYLILGRPIGFIFDDLDKFSKNRGFLFDNIEDLMPGPILENYNSLIAFIDELLESKDPYIRTRSIVNEKFNKFNDANSSARISDYYLKSRRG